MKYPAPEQWPDEGNVGEPWIDKFGRVRQPAVMRVADDGARTYGREAVARMVHRPPRVRVGAKVIVFPSRREATARQRERRSRSGRSSARSGDSGDDSDSEPPSEPPAAERWRWASP